MRTTHAEYDKIVTPYINDVTWVYHTQSGVQPLLSLTGIQSLRSFDSQIKRSETPIHIYSKMPAHTTGVQNALQFTKKSRYIVKNTQSFNNLLTQNPFSCLVQPKIICWQRKKRLRIAEYG
jgi:hypothetical protein